jgi:hypothetical protein
MPELRAKFKVNSVVKNEQSAGYEYVSVNMSPVYADKDGKENVENKSFSKWTPSGSLQMTITNPVAFNMFEDGQEYYVDLTRAS